MMENKLKYSKEFKLKIIEEVKNRSKHVRIEDIAKKYDISVPVVYKWQALYKKYGEAALSNSGLRGVNCPPNLKRTKSIRILLNEEEYNRLKELYSSDEFSNKYLSNRLRDVLLKNNK